MSFSFDLKITKFSDVLSQIKKEHLFIEEIATVDSADDVDALLLKLEEIPVSQIANYARSLKNTELELVFHALKSDIQSDMKSKLFTILKSRKKKRLFLYNWIMLQDNYTSHNLTESYEFMRDYMRENHPSEFNRSLLSRLSKIDGDLLHNTVKLIKQDGAELQDFFKKYKIMENGLFSKELTRLIFEQSKLFFEQNKLLFEQGSKEDFENNMDLFRGLLQSDDVNLFFMIRHYLSLFTVLEYLDDINNSIIMLYGEPSEKGVFWDKLDEELVIKFKEWIQTRELKDFFGDNVIKLSLWQQYYNNIKINKFEDAGILIIHMPGDYVVVDLLSSTKQSFLYKKKYFELKFEQYLLQREQGNIEWSIKDEEVVFIKDAQLNSIKANVFSIMYEGVARLYTLEIMENNMKTIL